MLFTENQLESILYGFYTTEEVATDYFNKNTDSILEDYSYIAGYIAVAEELDKQVKEYAYFKYAKENSSKRLETVKESLKVSEGFSDLQRLKDSIEYFKGREVYISLLNMFSDDLIEYAEKVISLYGDLLGECAYYRGDFNSFYYTYFIEEEGVTEEDVLCFTIDKVNEWLAE